MPKEKHESHNSCYWKPNETDEKKDAFISVESV